MVQGRRQGRAPQAARGGAGPGQARRLWRAAARPALRRPAPARRACPRAGQPAEGAAARRAARRARPQAARADAGRAEGAADSSSASPSSSSPTTRARRCRWPIASPIFNDGKHRAGRRAAEDLRAAGDPLRRRFRRLLERAVARFRRAPYRRAPLGEPPAGEHPHRRARATATVGVEGVVRGRRSYPVQSTRVRASTADGATARRHRAPAEAAPAGRASA